MNKWMIIPALAGAVAIGGVALANDSEVDAASKSEDILTLKEAKDLAIQKYGGKVTEIELEKTKSGYVYDVEVKSSGIEYDLDIDAITGKIKLEKQSTDTHVPKEVSTESAQKATPTHNLKVVESAQPRVAGTKLLTKDQVIAIAKKKAKGTVTEVELDSDDGRKHYDIEIKDGTYEYDFEIDAITGKILEFEKDRDDDAKKVNKQATATKTNKVASTKKAMLTKDQAIAIAMKQATGTVTDFELDEDDGRKVYEIEIENGTYEYEFEIDAFTGKVLKFEKDREDD